MDAQQIVNSIQQSQPIVGCKNCMALWKELGGFYQLWHEYPGDGMAQVYVEAALDVYLTHRNVPHQEKKVE